MTPDRRICLGQLVCPRSNSRSYCPYTEWVMVGWRSPKGRRQQIEKAKALFESNPQEFLKRCAMLP